MLFSSLEFLFIFFPFFLLSLYLLKRYKKLVIISFSIFFMYIIEQEFIFYLTLICLFNFYISRFLINKNKRKILVLSIFINLLILIYYKYLNFFLDTFNFSTLEHVILPVGISFISFHSISYLVDVYDKKIQPEKNFSNFFLFIFMFPQIISGPITRYSKVYKSIYLLKTLYNNVGLYYVFLGLCQKVLIADYLSIYVNNFYSLNNFQTGLNGLDSLLVAGIYMFQLYFDFSGYSHIAIGLGLIMGIRLPKNFNFPLSSFTIGEFWKKWHISLSTFIRDYLFIKINKAFKIKPNENNYKYFLSIIFCLSLSGIWHGANFTFLIWGILHGILISFEKIFNLDKKRNFILKLYFILSVCFTFVFFRSPTIEFANETIYAMFFKFNFMEAIILQHLNFRMYFTLLLCS